MKGMIGALVAIAAIGMLGTSIYSATQTGTITCMVTGKDRVSKPKGGSDMRIYTEDCDVLTVADSLLDVTWTSASLYSQIEIGKRYTFTYRGIRLPWLSMFPNIVKATAS